MNKKVLKKKLVTAIWVMAAFDAFLTGASGGVWIDNRPDQAKQEVATVTEVTGGSSGFGTTPATPSSTTPAPKPAPSRETVRRNEAPEPEPIPTTAAPEPTPSETEPPEEPVPGSTFNNPAPTISPPCAGSTIECKAG